MDNGDFDTNKSVAPGQANGFYLQSYYAFFELINENDQEAIISVEKLDDVAKERLSETELTQLKSSSSNGNNPAANLSDDFWKSIYNWCLYSSSSTKKYKYVVITRNNLNVGKTLELIHSSKNSGTAKKAYDVMREAFQKSNNQNPAFIKHRDYLCSPANEATITKIFVNLTIQVIDGSLAKRIDDSFRNKCLNASNYQEVKTYMLGWVDGIILSSIEKHKPIEIKVADFVKVLREQLQFGNDHLSFDCSYDHKDVISSLSERPIYIRQLDLIEVDEKEKYDAATNFLIESKNIRRLTDDLDVLPDQYYAYKKAIIDEYECIKRCIMDNVDGNDDIKIGKRVFHETNNECPQRVKLKGEDTPASFVRGTIQALSNTLDLGWHPDYKNKINNGSGGE